jgi:DNA end-binding protein Ku
MHNREYTVFLRPYNDHGLMLHTMYYLDEIREAPSVDGHAEVREDEVKVAHQLVNALAAKWDPAKYHDTFEENVKALIKAHLEGREVTPVEKPRKMAAPGDLVEALRLSLSQMADKKKAPQRVEEAQRANEVEVKGKKSPRKRATKRAA